MFDTMHIKCIQTEKVLSAYYYIHKKNVILRLFIMFSFFNVEISGPASVAIVYDFSYCIEKDVSNKVESSIICFHYYFDPLLFNKLCTLKYLLR